MSKSPAYWPLIAILAIAVTAPPIQAKGNGRLAGKIKNVSGEGLIGAVITIFRPDENGGALFFTRSDKNGSYNLVNVTPGSYYIQVSRDGYRPLTSSNVKIDSGKTTGIDVILQEFLGFISDDSDPRNWDVKSLMRTVSSRRLIFRDLPGITPAETASPFYRNGAMKVSSGTDLSSGNQAVLPGLGGNGILSNFAFAEPVSQHARMVFSGQLNSGYDSFWRVRNTYNYRPDESRDFRFSVGYGRLNLGRPSMADLGSPAQFFSVSPSLRESAVQTLLIGVEGTNRFFDIMEVGYGFDYSRLYSGPTNSALSPYLQVSVSPAPTWVFSTLVSSRRMSDENSLMLPEGERLNVAEPTYITSVGNTITMSQFRHSELAVLKSFADDTSVELAAFQDNTEGPGQPFLITTRTSKGTTSQLGQLTEEQSRQRGIRFVMDRRIFDFLSGSISYVYGSGTSLAPSQTLLSSDEMARNLLSYMQHSYYHSITSRLSARIPRTNTNFTTVLRWYPGDPITPTDFFADRMDVLTKGVNFSIRQAIPLPEFMGSAGTWEALIDVRNAFEQGRDHLRTRDGDMFLTRNPRMLRFGLNLRFY